MAVRGNSVCWTWRIFQVSGQFRCSGWQTKPSCDRARRGPSCDCRCCERHSESVVVLHAVPTTYSPVRPGANLRKEGVGNVDGGTGSKQTRTHAQKRLQMENKLVIYHLNCNALPNNGFVIHLRKCGNNLSSPYLYLIKGPLPCCRKGENFLLDLYIIERFQFSIRSKISDL